MNSYLKLSSVKPKTNCNCISPFYLANINGINPNTGHEYNSDDRDILKTALYRISNARGCNVSVCCDPNDPTKMPDAEFTKQFIQKFPKIMPMYEGSNLTSIKLSTTANVKESGWQTPSTHMICKITKATITDTSNSTVKLATNLVSDCFTDQCNQAENITMNTLLQNSKTDMKYTSVDDARVTQAIMENNITYVKEYIRKYKQVDSPLTNDDYNNRMIHIASKSNSMKILNMLIALKAKLNIKNKLGETPIHLAVSAANLLNMDAILLQGVDLTIQTVKGETPMFYAMKTGDMRVINMLYSNGSPILGVDKAGNNLIHYCIKNCPSFKDSDPNTTNASNSITNTKSDIIKFLIDHGVSTEQANLAGVSPLELVSKEINKEINRECSLRVSNDSNAINEMFFNVKPNGREGFTNDGGSNNNGGDTKTKFANTDTNTYGAVSQNINGNTLEHISLLQVQTMLFNNILKNNPAKYSKYISVDDIPKGSPIEILDTVCYGDGMTGNEDSEECIAKGGQLVKVVNKTTKIKLELIPEDQTKIDALDSDELYFKKEFDKIPDGTVPQNIKTYNNSLTNGQKKEPQSMPQTTGITYVIGQPTTNDVGVSNQKPPVFNPQPTQSIMSSIPESAVIPPAATSSSASSSSISSAHPPMYDDEVIHKCKTDAIRNSTKITEAQLTIPQITKPTSSLSSFFSKYQTYIIIIVIFIIILFALIMLIK